MENGLSNTHMTRESWLQAAIAEMRDWLQEKSMTIPARVLVAAGFPKYGAPKAIGQCWAPVCTEDDTTHVFISPTLHDPIEVLATLLHELVHAAVGCECGHRGPFFRGVRTLGLAGKATATYAEPGSELHGRLAGLSEALGPYPHSALRPVGKPRPPGGGWVKLVSTEEESYILRISPKALKEHGLPNDPWGSPMVEAGEE